MVVQCVCGAVSDIGLSGISSCGTYGIHWLDAVSCGGRTRSVLLGFPKALPPHRKEERKEKEREEKKRERR